MFLSLVYPRFRCYPRVGPVGLRKVPAAATWFQTLYSNVAVVCRVHRIFSKCNRIRCGREPRAQGPVRPAASVSLIEVPAQFRFFLRRHSPNFTNEDFGDLRKQESLVPLFMHTDNRFGNFDALGHILLPLTLRLRRNQMRAEPNQEVARQALERMAVLVDLQRRQALTNSLL